MRNAVRTPRPARRLFLAAAAALALAAPAGPTARAEGAEAERHGPRAPEISVVALVRALPSQEQELGRRLQALVAPTRREPGNVNYDLHRSNDDPGTWVLYENWRTLRDLDEHLRSPHFLDFVAHGAEVLAAPPEVHYLTMTSRPEAGP